MIIPLHDPSQWPLRMTREEVAQVIRRSSRTLRARINSGRFPPPDGDGTWARATVEAYANGGVRTFERDYAKRHRRESLQMVSR